MSLFRNLTSTPSDFTLWILLIILVSGCATPSILVTKEQQQGDLFFNQHNYSGAINHYVQMLEASKKLGIYRNLSMEADVHRKIANGYEMLGRYETALSNVREALALDSADNNLLGIIGDHRQAGKDLIYMGLFRSGIASLEKSLSLSEGMDQSLKNTHRLAIADTYLALGQLYAVTGLTDKSLDYAEKSLSLFRQAGDSKGEMESDLILGSVFSDIGEMTAAMGFIEQSRKIAEDLGMGIYRHLQLLASLSAATGRYEDALRYQEKAIQDARKYGIAGQIIWTLIGMGDIYRDLGDYERAEKYYRQAGTVKDTTAMKAGSLQASLDMRLGEALNANKFFAGQGSVAGEGISSLRYAELLIQNNKFDSAMFYLGQGGKMFRLSGNKQGTSNVSLLKGSVLVDQGKYDLARIQLDSAAVNSEYPETVWQAWFNLGRMYEGLNQDEKAIDAYRNSISVIEKIRGNLTVDEFKSVYFNSKRKVYDRLVNLLWKTGKYSESFQYSEDARARAFYDILANRRINFRGAGPGDLMSLEQEKRQEIQKLFRLLQKGESPGNEAEKSRSSDESQLRSILTQAREEYDEILQKIKLNNPEYAEMVAAEPVTLTDLQKRLDLNTAALAYWISDKELIIWFVTHSGLISRKVKVDTGQLTAMVEKTRKAIQSLSTEEAARGLTELYDLLINPVEADIAKVSNLVVIPNGSLHFLPFQALMNRKGEYLVQKYNLIYAPSASVFTFCNDRLIKSGSKFMGVALSDISVDNNVGLPGTEDELKRILPLFPDNISAFGKQSTETFVKENAGNYSFMHFATHGSYNLFQPLYSHLLFPASEKDDGKLNVYEVFEMKINAKLVTLSACETGLGNISLGDELTGLSRAFLFAGSSAVIVSLWSVADYPTALLMASFYRYLKDHPLEEALTLAQRDVIKVFPQPLYWAPFILIGNGQVSLN